MSVKPAAQRLDELDITDVVLKRLNQKLKKVPLSFNPPKKS